MPDTTEILFDRYGPAYRWLVTFTALLGVIMTFIAATASFISLPDIMGTYGIGRDRAQWVATSWMASLVVCLLISYKVTDAFGHRVVYVGTVLMFTAGAVLSAMADNLSFFILGRVFQGASAGIVQPMAMAAIFMVFPPERRGLAMGAYGMGMLVAASTGSAFGGYVLDNFNWRLSYIAPATASIVALPLGLLFMPHKKPHWKALKIDWHAFVFLCLSMLCLLWVLGNGQRLGWVSEKILIATMVCVLSSIAFAVLQFTSKQPLIELSLLRNHRLAAAALVNAVFGTGFSVLTLYTPVFVQEIQGYSATRAGVLMLPAGLAMMGITLFAGRLADFIRERFIIFGGLIALASGAALMFKTDVNSSFLAIAVYALIGRAGIGFIMPVIDKVALQSVPASSVGQASSVVSFFRQWTGAVAMGLATVVVEIRTHGHIDTLTATQTAANSATRDYLEFMKQLLMESGIPEALRENIALNHLGKAISAQANTLGYNEMFLTLSLFLVIGLIPAWIATSK